MMTKLWIYIITAVPVVLLVIIISVLYALTEEDKKKPLFTLEKEIAIKQCEVAELEARIKMLETELDNYSN